MTKFFKLNQFGPTTMKLTTQTLFWLVTTIFLHTMTINELILDPKYSSDRPDFVETLYMSANIKKKS